MVTHGLEMINISTWRWTSFDLPVTITSVSTLSNGIVVTKISGSSIQSLSLDKGYSPSQEPIPPALTVRPLYWGKIIVIVPTSRDCVVLLETATIQRVLVIPAQKDLLVPTDRTVVLCASPEKKAAVHCFVKRGKEYLQLWEFRSQSP